MSATLTILAGLAQAVAQEAQAVPPQEDAAPGDVDNGLIDGRRRPGYEAPLPEPIIQDNPMAAAGPAMRRPLPRTDHPGQSRRRARAAATCLSGASQHPDSRPLAADRKPWHRQGALVRSLSPEPRLKGDRPLDPDKVKWLPIKGDDWFFVGNAVSDTLFEPRSFPIPVGVQTTERPNSLDVFGKNASYVLSQTFIASAALIKGSTAFKPPEIEYRLTLALQRQSCERAPSGACSMSTLRHQACAPINFLGVQEAFIDYHLRNTSDRYDFESIRIGIQPFQSDFRGFLFNDEQLGIRFFGNRDNNRFQFNVAGLLATRQGHQQRPQRCHVRVRATTWSSSPISTGRNFLIPGLTSQVDGRLQPQPGGRPHQDRRQRFPGSSGFAGNSQGSGL